MIVVGLDLSIRATGVCTLSGDPGSPLVRTQLIPQDQVKGEEARTKRLIAIADAILLILRAENAEHVIIEAPAKNQVWQMAAIGEVHGVVKTEIYKALGVVAQVEQATKMRKLVIGTIEKKFEEFTDKKGKAKRRISYGMLPGRAGKPRRATVKDIIELRLRDRGLVFPTQDEMDAYVAACYCWKQLFPANS